jgi:RNA polymerase sigma factor (sigma-70 family)
MEGIGQLLARARADDQQAWESLHLYLQPYLLRQAQRLLGHEWPERSVSDLIQESWLQACKKLDQFSGGPDDRQTAALFRAWLRQIMTNLHKNLIRAGAAEKRAPQSAVASLNAAGQATSSSDLAQDVPGRDLTASQALSQREEQNRVRQALVRLPDLERTIIRMHILDGVSMPEIARELGLTFDQVRYHKDKGLRLLGEDLGGSS